MYMFLSCLSKPISNSIFVLLSVSPIPRCLFGQTSLVRSGKQKRTNQDTRVTETMVSSREVRSIQDCESIIRQCLRVFSSLYILICFLRDMFSCFVRTCPVSSFSFVSCLSSGSVSSRMQFVCLTRSRVSFRFLCAGSVHRVVCSIWLVILFLDAVNQGTEWHVQQWSIKL